MVGGEQWLVVSGAKRACRSVKSGRVVVTFRETTLPLFVRRQRSAYLVARNLTGSKPQPQVNLLVLWQRLRHPQLVGSPAYRIE